LIVGNQGFVSDMQEFHLFKFMNFSLSAQNIIIAKGYYSTIKDDMKRKIKGTMENFTYFREAIHLWNFKKSVAKTYQKSKVNIQNSKYRNK
jgi:hypothetical protein